MSRAALLLLLLLLPDDARVDALLREWTEIRSDRTWTAVRRKRAIAEEASLLDGPRAGRLLSIVFSFDQDEPTVRIAALRGLFRTADSRSARTAIGACFRDRNDVYPLVLREALAGRGDDDLAEWMEARFPGTAPGIAALGAMGRERSFDAIAGSIGSHPSDPRHWAEALFAAARTGKARALPLLRSALGAGPPEVRAAAVEALAETGTPGAVSEILPCAADPAPVVRLAAVAALARIGGRPALDGLSRFAGDARARVREEARLAAEALGGAAGDPAGPADSVPTYHGMDLRSDRLLFALDVSASMGKGTPPRIDVAREELCRTLSTLDARTRFNVVVFGGSALWWSDAEAPATPSNVRSATEFVARMTPGGRTNVSDTFDDALARNPEADTIFLLGDGCPSAGRTTDPDEILARIAWANRWRRIRIHTIALIGRPPAPGTLHARRSEDPEEGMRFLARLAAENRGTFLPIVR